MRNENVSSSKKKLEKRISFELTFPFPPDFAEKESKHQQQLFVTEKRREIIDKSF